MAKRVFDIDEFVENPTHDQLFDIRKADWATIAKQYNISFTTTMRKEQLKNVVIESLVEEGILTEEALQTMTPIGLPPPENTDPVTPKTQTSVVMLNEDKLFELEKLKLQYQLQLEMEREKQQLEKEKTAVRERKTPTSFRSSNQTS